MNLYLATNGYIGDSWVRCYVIAKDEDRALELAIKHYKNDEQAEYHEIAWSRNVKVTLLHEDCTKEFISDIED